MPWQHLVDEPLHHQRIEHRKRAAGGKTEQRDEVQMQVASRLPEQPWQIAKHNALRHPLRRRGAWRLVFHLGSFRRKKGHWLWKTIQQALYNLSAFAF